METVSKKQRIRPKLLDGAYLALMQFLTDAKPTRQQQNIYYRQRALGLLMDDSHFLWLCDEQSVMKGRPHSLRPNILAELGRIADEEDLQSMALQICKSKPKSKQAVAMIRRWRLGKTGEGDALQLANEIIHAIDGYIARLSRNNYRADAGFAYDRSGRGFKVQ